MGGTWRTDDQVRDGSCRWCLVGPADTGQETRQALPIYSQFSFSLDDCACQQLAKLLFAGCRREVIEWGVGPVAQPVLGSGNVASVIKRVCPRFVPVIFPVVPVFMINANDS